MSKFKEGDKVICINNDDYGGCLTISKEYTVTEEDGYNQIRIQDDLGVKFYYSTRRFKLAAELESLVASGTRLMTLPTDSNERKGYPLLSGCVKYFPAALAGVANISKLGNDKHNPGEPLHHARGKSMDHGDCIIRHLIDTEDLLAAFNRGDSSITKEQILMEANQLAWRALAYSQMINEQFGAPLAPGAK